MRLRLRRNVEPIQQNLPHSSKSQINALKIVLKLPKPQGGTRERKGHPLSTSTPCPPPKIQKKLPSQHHSRSLAAHVPSPSYLSLTIPEIEVHFQSCSALHCCTRSRGTSVTASTVSFRLGFGTTQLSFISGLFIRRLCEFGFGF